MDEVEASRLRFLCEVIEHDAVPWLVAAARRLVAEAQVRLAMRSS